MKICFNLHNFFCEKEIVLYEYDYPQLLTITNSHARNVLNTSSVPIFNFIPTLFISLQVRNFLFELEDDNNIWTSPKPRKLKKLLEVFS